MKAPCSDRWTQATNALSIDISGDVVFVRGDGDEVLCTFRRWSEAKAQLQRQQSVGGDEPVAEARKDLWLAVGAPRIALKMGDMGSYEGRRSLALSARTAGLLPSWAKGLIQ